ncbi:DUF3106 domain-containing protein [Thermomonas sp. XSG]|mgnify:FL=1|jgi:hypothetical protein|uniref:DUF3106 domain-containing protein n=1 Tax=Thermomonas sp. XSG TaxID=2771436 RepID=UPI00086D0A55|nr:DUF3106 domain-containing protein [Thermomonas sp. XSG]ODU53580.1 MAG: hypothetical protein ABS98_00115 [Xanthomonadaceae bacterium SCN 69-48]QNU14596.1 DUF3106 domain-containing protein [Thermomonas sp. XSG]
MYRHFAPLLLLASLALAPTTALAQEAKADAMPAWDQLTPAQRELLIAPVRDRWNREPEKRERFMEYAKRWKAMPQPQRERARHGMQRWEGMTPEQREQARALFHAVRGLDKDARGEFMEKWRQMTPQQRTDWVKTHPAPERRDPD